MTRVLPVFLALLLLVPAAHATLRVSSAQPIGTPSFAPPEGQRNMGAVASDGENFLAVWSGYATLEAAIVTPDGTVTAPMRTLFTAQYVSNISACWTGSAYLVTFRGDTPKPAVYAVTLEGDGSVVTGPTKIIDNAVPGDGSLAFNGSHALLAYVPAASNGAKAALLDAGGTPIATGLLLTDDANASIPRVTSDGSEFAVVWWTIESATPGGEEFDTLHLLRVSGTATVMGTPLTVGTVESGRQFGVAFGGGVVAIAAMESHLIKPGLAQPRLLRFIVDPRSGFVIAQPAIETDGDNTGVLWNGSKFIAWWSGSPALRTISFDSTLEAIPPQPFAAAPIFPGMPAVLATNGKTIFGAWSDAVIPDPLNTVERAIRGALLGPDAATFAPAPFLVSIGWSRQYDPAIATSGSELLLVWLDSSASSGGRLVGMRVSPNGTPLDAAPFEIAPNATRLQTPAVTFTGAAYLVVWAEQTTQASSTIHARRVGRDGSLGDRIDFGAGAFASAASTASTTLLIFGAQHIVGYRFNANAERIDTTPITIGDGLYPKVATNGTDFLVAWQVGSDYWQFPTPNLVDVLGVRVTALGTVDAAPLPIATGTKDQQLQTVASDGRDYTVFYELSDPQRPDGVLAAKRVLREGQLDGTTAEDDGVIVGPLHGAVSAVRNGAGFTVAVSGVEPESIVLLHTDVNGNVDDWFLLGAAFPEYPASTAALTATGPDSFALASVHHVDDGIYAGTWRLFLRFGSNDGPNRGRIAHH